MLIDDGGGKVGRGRWSHNSPGSGLFIIVKTFTSSALFRSELDRSFDFRKTCCCGDLKRNAKL